MYQHHEGVTEALLSHHFSGVFVCYFFFPKGQEGSSLRDLARDLPSALLPLFHSESTRRFFPLFLRDPQKLGNPGACGGTRWDVDVTLSIGTGAVYLGCSSRPSRKSSSRAAGCPVAVHRLWSRVMGEVQLFHACCVLDTTHPHLLPAHRQGDPGAAVLTFGRGHPSCRRTGLTFKPGSSVKARAEFCMIGGLHRNSLLKVSVITRPDFYWERFHLNQDGVLIAPRLYPVSASRLIKNVAYIDLHVAFCPLYLLSEIQNSEVYRVLVDAFGNEIGFGACAGDAGLFIPRPSPVSACQSHYCLIR